MEFKRSAVSAAVLGAALMSGSALAGVSGNVGAVSQYMFRGISQGSGAAVQGGVDYEADSGFYAGLWGSNIDWGVGSVETDVYAGFSGGDSVSYDVGVIYYYYPEEDETGTDPSVNTVEVYGSLGFGPVGISVAYSPKFFGFESGGDDVSSLYVNASASFPISDSLSLDTAVGFTSLSEEVFDDYIDGVCGTSSCDSTDSYIDYSIGMSKSIDDTLSASFSIVGTDLEADDPKFLVGITKSFDL
jgi:uncharacterized protein (TIGR02001 family)